MHAKSSAAFGAFTVTNDITAYTKAKVFSHVGKKTDLYVRFSTVAGERGAADAERDIHGYAVKLSTDEGNWDLVGNNTLVFFARDPLSSPTSSMRSSVIRARTCAAPATTGISGRCSPQPGKLFRLRTPEQQQVVFENTARAMGDAPKESKIRHLGNCLKADPAYGEGFDGALGIRSGDMPA